MPAVAFHSARCLRPGLARLPSARLSSRLASQISAWRLGGGSVSEVDSADDRIGAGPSRLRVDGRLKGRWDKDTSLFNNDQRRIQTRNFSTATRESAQRVLSTSPASRPRPGKLLNSHLALNSAGSGQVRSSAHLSSRSSSSSQHHHHRRCSFLLANLSPGSLLQTAKLASSTQSRSHAGHSHDHDHSHDHHGHDHSHSPFSHHHHGPNTFLTSTDKTDAGVRITRIGLLVNLLMAITKGLGGMIFNSQALVADAFHSLTDLVADFLTLGTVSFARRGPSERFPNGYGKIESLGSVGVSGLLLFGGLAMGYSSVLSLYAEFFVENAHEFLEHHASHGHGHSHGHSHGPPSLNAAWLALGSILIKEWLYRATMKVALERKSTVLASNAVHHRIDSLTSIVALLAIGASHVFQGATFFDPVGGLIVSLMVISAGWSNTSVAVMELVDVGLDSETKSSVTSAAEKAAATSLIPVKIVDVGGIKSGQNYLVELGLEVPKETTIGELGMLEREVREVVGSECRGVKRIKVRFVGEGVEVRSEFVSEEAQAKAEEEKESKKEQ